MLKLEIMGPDKFVAVRSRDHAAELLGRLNNAPREDLYYDTCLTEDGQCACQKYKWDGTRPEPREDVSDRYRNDIIISRPYAVAGYPVLRGFRRTTAGYDLKEQLAKAAATPMPPIQVKRSLPKPRKRRNGHWKTF